MSESTSFSPWLDPTQAPYIQIQNVTKKFGEFTAIDNLTLDIYPAAKAPFVPARFSSANMPTASAARIN